MCVCARARVVCLGSGCGIILEDFEEEDGMSRCMFCKDSPGSCAENRQKGTKGGSRCTR